MPWYCVYRTADNAAVSFTSTEPDTLPDGLAYVEIACQPEIGQAWDPASKRVVEYTPAPADPTGAFYEVPAWQWVYAVGPYRLEASAVGARSLVPTTSAAQAHIRANVSVDDLTAAISWATARRDSIATALTAAGVDPATNQTYQAAQAVLAFLGGCL